MHAVSFEMLMRRVEGEISELPCTRVSVPYMAKLCGLEIEICQAIIAAMLKSGRLIPTGDDGMYMHSAMAHR